MPNVDYVNAQFGGNQVQFKLSRNDRRTAALEMALGGSAYAAFQRFGSGTWRIDDIRVVLSLAHPDAEPHAPMMTAPGMPYMSVAPAVADVLSSNPPGVYAPLTARVLEAFLFGITEDRAQWDEAAALA